MSCNALKDGCCTDARTPWARDLLIAPSICARCEHYAGPDRGLGDKVARLTRATGVARVVETVARATGKPCGCAARRAALNARFPSYPQSGNPNPPKVDEGREPI